MVWGGREAHQPATMFSVNELPGSSDCEARSWDWGQPVLFATSWAYVVVGVALLLWLWRRSDVARGWGLAFAVALVLTGLGSVDYHGPVVAPQPLAHDGGLAFALLIALGIDLLRLRRDNRLAVSVVVGLSVFGLVALLWIPQFSPVLAGVIAVGLGIAEFGIYQRRLRTIGWTQYAAVACVGLGVVVFALSRTGGPLCDPESLVQGHGVWHVLTACALGLWGLGALSNSRLHVGLPTAPIDSQMSTRPWGDRI